MRNRMYDKSTTCTTADSNEATTPKDHIKPRLNATGGGEGIQSVDCIERGPQVYYMGRLHVDWSQNCTVDERKPIGQVNR